MSTLPSTLPLSAISIPGTHNSHTYYRALPSVRCQVVSVQDQLANGIRFLDIRVQPVHATDASKKDLYLVHGAFPISLTGPKYLEPILKACFEFLEKNPSETILVSLKREGVGSSTDEHLSEILEKHYIAPNKDRWLTSPSLPYLKDARGKLVLVRRYTVHNSLRSASADNDFGLDATSWPHNSTHATHGVFCVQDFCEVMDPSDIPKKLLYSNEHLVRAAECTAFIPGVNTDEKNPIPAGPLHLNFLTGSNFWNRSCWPDKIAKVVNRGIEEWICMGHHLQDPLITPREPGRSSIENRDPSAVKKAKSGDGGTGVVIMDNVGEHGDWDLVKLVIGMNIGVGMKGGVA
jgi:1-phosphatidylinositol phosphodiesterase